MKAFIKKILIMIYHIMAAVLPVNEKKAVFMSNMGRNCSGNVRAIYEKMKKDDRFKDIIRIWAFNGDFFGMAKKHGKKIFPRGCLRVRYGGLRYYFHMATAGIWIFDTRQEPYLKKRRKNFYLMTWHGTPLKKLGLDLEDLNMSGEKRNLKDYADSFIKEAAKWDCLIAQNEYSAEIFKRCFGYEGEVHITGYPRNDRLQMELSAEKKRKELSEKAPKKVLLYAPTWRDDEYIGDGFYKCPSRPDFLKLQEALGDKYRIIVKLHYLVKLLPGDIPRSCIESGFVKVYGNEVDITSLYLKADALIGDYTSAMFDYSVLRRPMFFFCYDYEKYRDTLRGFYTDFSEIAPGPISKNEDELIRDIKKTFEGNGMDQYREKAEEFRQKFNELDDGLASERVLDIVALKTGRS